MDNSSDASTPSAAMAASSSSLRYPDWVMLDPHTRLNYPRPTLDYPEEHFRATHAYAETSTGDPVRVSFRAVPPPGTSRLYVNWTPRTKRPSSSSSSRIRRGEEDRWDGPYGQEPKVVAAHGNSILLQVTAHDRNSSDFFVYTIHCVGQPPSLRRLPRCDHRFGEDRLRGIPAGGLEHMRMLPGISLLCDVDRGEFVVADLMMLPIYSQFQFPGDDDTPMEAGICVFRSSSPGGSWKATKPRILHKKGQGTELIWWNTDAVVPFGESLCYVDYLRGVLFMDVLSEHPQLRYVRLPVRIPVGDPVDQESGLRGCPEQSRSVCVTNGGGTMKFVEVVTTTVFVSFSREPVSSSFVINVWKLRQDTMTWEKESNMDDAQLWSLQGYSNDLPRVAPTSPLVSMEEPDVIYFVLSNWSYRDDGETWIIVVDMLNKTLRSSSRYTRVHMNSFETDGNMASATLTRNRAFMACEFSKYLHVPENN